MGCSSVDAVCRSARLHDCSQHCFRMKSFWANACGDVCHNTDSAASVSLTDLLIHIQRAASSTGQPSAREAHACRSALLLHDHACVKPGIVARLDRCIAAQATPQEAAGEHSSRQGDAAECRRAHQSRGRGSHQGRPCRGRRACHPPHSLGGEGGRRSYRLAVHCPVARVGTPHVVPDPYPQMRDRSLCRCPGYLHDPNGDRKYILAALPCKHNVKWHDPQSAAEVRASQHVLKFLP